MRPHTHATEDESPIRNFERFVEMTTKNGKVEPYQVEECLRSINRGCLDNFVDGVHQPVIEVLGDIKVHLGKVGHAGLTRWNVTLCPVRL
jgi:hypothetical protein